LRICLPILLALPFLCMPVPTLLPCDGCGQPASPEHIARRLQRLEWATRFRPIHIHALLLTAAGPEADSDFLYAPNSTFTGQAGIILSALGVPTAGKSSDEVLSEFQKRGLVLTSLLECRIEPGVDAAETRALLENHLSPAVARIRRSLKPKRILIISPELQPFLAQLALVCPAIYTPLSTSAAEIAAFRARLSRPCYSGGTL
jgi:hypothetical protein